MSVNEEVEEHVHHAHEPFDKMVAGSMAIIAAGMAVVSVLGQHYNTEMLLDQQLASDQWALYQGKDIRRYQAQTVHDSLQALKAEPATVSKYADEAVKYRSQTAETQHHAREYEKERDKHKAIAGRFHFGEIFLEVAIVLCSLAILMKRRPFFMAGVFSALVGAVIAVTAYWA
jgi:uncharacterized protein DUF4337